MTIFTHLTGVDDRYILTEILYVLGLVEDDSLVYQHTHSTTWIMNDGKAIGTIKISPGKMVIERNEIPSRPKVSSE